MKRSKKQHMEGVLHDITLSFVTQKYMDRTLGDKGETVAGAYVSADNKIYISKEDTELKQVHTILHEFYHSFVDHTVRMDEEAKADSFAAWVMRVFNVTEVKQLIKGGGNGST